MNIGKLISIAGAFALISIMSLGCTKAADSGTRSSSGANGSTVVADSDAGPNVVLTVTADALLRETYATVGELNKSSAVDAVAKGRVSATQDIFLEGVAYRLLTVDVAKTFKGTLPERIKVYEDGGYVKLKDMLKEASAHLDASTYTGRQIEEGVVDVVFMGARHSQVGDEVVLYLRKNPNASQGDSYQLVSSVQGRLTLNKKTAKYERPSGPETTEGFQDEIAAAELESGLLEVK